MSVKENPTFLEELKVFLEEELEKPLSQAVSAEDLEQILFSFDYKVKNNEDLISLFLRQSNMNVDLVGIVVRNNPTMPQWVWTKVVEGRKHYSDDLLYFVKYRNIHDLWEILIEQFVSGMFPPHQVNILWERPGFLEKHTLLERSIFPNSEIVLPLDKWVEYHDMTLNDPYAADYRLMNHGMVKNQLTRVELLKAGFKYHLSDFFDGSSMDDLPLEWVIELAKTQYGFEVKR